MKKLEMILFDAGDTLIFLSPPKEQLLIDACEKLGLSLDFETAALAYRIADETIVTETLKDIKDAVEKLRIRRQQQLTHEWNRALLRGVGFQGDVEQALREIEQAFRNCSWSWQTNAHTIATLDSLKQRGYRTAILSNFDRNLPSICKDLGIAERVEFLVVSSLVGSEKPDPRIFEIAMEKASLRAEEMLYVGDHAFDVLGARGVGMPVAWINRVDRKLPEGISEPDYEITGVSELLEIL